jgi:hypothetical protein
MSPVAGAAQDMIGRDGVRAARARGSASRLLLALLGSIGVLVFLGLGICRWLMLLDPQVGAASTQLATNTAMCA